MSGISFTTNICPPSLLLFTHRDTFTLLFDITRCGLRGILKSDTLPGPSCFVWYWNCWSESALGWKVNVEISIWVQQTSRFEVKLFDGIAHHHGKFKSICYNCEINRFVKSWPVLDRNVIYQISGWDWDAFVLTRCRASQFISSNCRTAGTDRFNFTWDRNVISVSVGLSSTGKRKMLIKVVHTNKQVRFSESETKMAIIFTVNWVIDCDALYTHSLFLYEIIANHSTSERSPTCHAAAR
jgi:hypothetical protein